MSTSTQAPEAIVFQATDRLAHEELAARLYRNLSTAVAELVINGLAAATLLGVKPRIIIRRWDPEEHLYSPDGPALSVLDNGTGFTSAVISAYGQVGTSVHHGNVAVPGEHGLGKMAAFALGSEGFYIISSTSESGPAWVYEIPRVNVFNPQGFQPVRVERSELPGLPKSGPFTMILVPQFRDSFDLKELRDDLTFLLPMRAWEVVVQGEQVSPRKVQAQATMTTDRIPALGGTIRFELAVAEVSGGRDALWLVDAGSGRLVTELMDLPGARRLLDGALLNPRLIGSVFIPGIEAQSSAGRAGLSATYLSSAPGQAMIGALNLFGGDLARQVLGEAAPSENPALDLARQVVQSFRTAFGEPEAPVGGGGKDGGGANPTPGPKGPGGGTGGGRGPRGPKTGSSGGTDKLSPDAVVLRIEGRTYQVMSFRTADPVPVSVRKGTLVINTDHPTTKRLLAATGPARRDGLVRALVDAHVVSTRDALVDVTAAAYELLEKVLGGQK